MSGSPDTSARLLARREARRRAVRRRRASAISVLAVCAALIALVLVGGGGSSHRVRTRSPHASASTAAPRLAVAASPAGSLSEALQDAAGAADPASKGILVIGGLDGEEASKDTITRVSEGRASTAGTLPRPLHDACAARVGGAVYLFGGGSQESFSAILRLSPGSATGAPITATQIGSLPTAASDVACAVLDGTVYVVGGYTGSYPLRTIVSWSPGTQPREVAMLPRPLRYAAAAAVGKQILIAGGTSDEAASRDVYAFDPAGARVSKIGALPFPVTHAAGAALGGDLLVIGGRSSPSGARHRSVLAVTPSGSTAIAGELPAGLSDAAAAAPASAGAAGVLLAGGADSSGAPQSAILALTGGRR